MTLLLARVGAWWLDAPPALVIVLKATAILALAWLADAALRRRNPRWRVLAWRLAAAALVGASALALAPPVVAWRLARPAPPAGPTTLARPDPPPPAEPVASAGLAPETAPATPAGPTEAPDEIGPLTALPGEMHGAAPDPAEPTPGRPFPWVGAWLAGVAVLGVRQAIGSIRLRRIVRRGLPASAGVADEFRRAWAALGGTGRVCLLVVDDLPVPCLAPLGWRTSALLLPADCLRADAAADRRAIYAHELAHARGRDLAWNRAWAFLGVVGWFHPLAWRARLAHAEACDLVADAAAAGFVGDDGAYGRTLARLALRAHEAQALPALAMARTADVRRRIASLHRCLGRSPLSRRLIMIALAPAALLAALVGGFGFVPALADPAPPPAATPAQDPAPSSPEAPKEAGAIAVRVVDDATGRPLPGATVESRIGATSDDREATATTGPDGTANVRYDATPTPAHASVSARHPGYVRRGFTLGNLARPIALPAATEFRLRAGRVVGGSVRDEAGNPVAGATVTLRGPIADERDRTVTGRLAAATTDAAGAWRTDEAPGDLGSVRVEVDHPDFLRNADVRLADDPSGTTAILRRGATLAGRVTDRDGRPVARARVRLTGGLLAPTEPVEAATDAEGRFLLAHCPPGQSVLTVEADGFAPDSRNVGVGPTEAGPVAVALGPGSTLRARVVDRAGRPVAGASWSIVRWQDRQVLRDRGRADAAGRFEWRNAPPDAVSFLLRADGYRPRADVTLTAGPAEQVVTLEPSLTLSGRVTDARTSEPIRRFRTQLTVGPDRGDERTVMAWRVPEVVDDPDGRYSRAYDILNSQPWLVRIMAPGYRPVESRRFDPAEGPQTWDVALESQEWPGGTVVGPDGRPVAGAEVIAAPPDQSIYLHGARPRLQNYRGGADVDRTDAAGRFQVQPSGGTTRLVVASPLGFAEVPAAEVRPEMTVRLAAWGRVEGDLRLGGQALAGGTVRFDRPQPDRDAPGDRNLPGYGVPLRVEATTQTDGDGRFRFDQLPPGPGVVGRSHPELVGRPGVDARSLWQVPVDVPAGGVAEAHVGAAGRAVLGRVAPPADLRDRVDLAVSGPAVIQAPGAVYGRGPRGHVRYAARLDADGRFRVDDVPPGAYRLLVSLQPTDDRVSYRDLPAVDLPIEVPGPVDGGPVDLGDLVPQPRPAPRPAAAATPAPAPAPDPKPVPSNAAPVPAPPAPAPQASGEIRVRVVADATGAPRAGVVVTSDIGILPDLRKSTATTGPDGTAVVPYDATPPPQYVAITVHDPGFVAAGYTRNAQIRPFEMPREHEFRLRAGRVVGGTVRDEAGRPIAGARVTLGGRTPDSSSPSAYLRYGEVETDAAGAWRFDEAPGDLGSVDVQVGHPDFIANRDVRLVDGIDSTVVLRRGVRIQGRVVDAAGRPVSGARVLLGRSRAELARATAEADAAGRFTLAPFPPGPTLLTVEADGFAPDLREFLVGPEVEAAPVEVALKPGATLRARVVDRVGRPVPNAFWAVNSYRGERTLADSGHTDAEGRFEWRGAPPEAVGLHFMEVGHQTLGPVSLTAGPAEQVVTMDPALVVAGRVTDARTGAPVREFDLSSGSTPKGWTGPVPPSWGTPEPVRDADGRFAGRSRMTNIQSLSLRIQAPGYRVAESRPYRLDEGSQEWDVALEPQDWLVGSAVGPDGKPVEGAEVVIAPPGAIVVVRGTRLRASNNRVEVRSARTDAGGWFRFPPVEGEFRLVAASPLGFAEVAGAAFRADPTIRLAAWGRVEGAVRVGGRPLVDEVVSFNRPRPERSDAAGGRAAVTPLGVEATTRTDAAGRFRLDQIPPGPGLVGRLLRRDLPTPGNAAATLHSGWQALVDVPAGGTAVAEVGVPGRAVVGRVVPPVDLAGPVDWPSSGPVSIRLQEPEYGRGPRGYVGYFAVLDREGRFRVDDVPPGRYRLSAPIRDGVRPFDINRSWPVGVDIDVPGPADGPPVDLGDLAPGPRARPPG